MLIRYYMFLFFIGIIVCQTHPTDTMSVNTWLAVSTNECSDFKPSPEPTGSQSQVMDAWCGGTYDPDRHWLYVWGGGHADYAGNEMYVFKTDSLKWARLTDPSTDYTSAGATYTDGLPRARHTYNYLEYDPTVEKFYSFGGSSLYPDGGGGTDSCSVFNPADSTWATTNVVIPDGDGNLSGGVCAYDPKRQTVWVHKDGSNDCNLLEFDASENSWTTHVPTEYLSDYKQMVVDTLQNRIYAIGTGKFYMWKIDEDSLDDSSYPFDITTNGTQTIQDKSPPPIAYDGEQNLVVGWAGGGDSVYTFDYSTLTWTGIKVTGDNPGSLTAHGMYGRFRYMPEYNAFVTVTSTTDSVYFLKLSAGGQGNNLGSILQTFTLTSDTTDTCAFTVGLGFGEGDCTSPTLDISNYQLTVKKSWNDGSVKHAIASGWVDADSGVAETINVYSGGNQPSGTALVESDIATAAPTASVGIAGKDTVNLSDLLGSPERTWLTGLHMVEAHYKQDMDDSLTVWFHVRLYSTDDVWIRAIVQNGSIGFGSDAITYTPKIIIGDSIYNTEVTHYPRTRYCIDGWIGNDPDIKIAQDCDYLEESKLVPNYWKESPDASVLNGLYQAYTPGSNGSWTDNMNGTGYMAQIGILPKWDALYINSDGDYRAFNSVLANAKAVLSYSIAWVDSSTDQPIILRNWSEWTVEGDGGGGSDPPTVNGLTWDASHHGSAGYLAYLITGDYYYLEIMQFQSAISYLVISSTAGDDTSRILAGQTRKVAWIHRTLGQTVAICPSDSIINDLASLLSENVAHWDSIRSQVGMNEIGYIYSAELASGIYGVGLTAPWQQHFWVQTYGYLDDIEPLVSMAKIDSVKDYMYKSIVGILGPNGVDNYCFTAANSYTIKISTAQNNETDWFDSWGVVHDSSKGSPNTSCGNTMAGSISVTSYWANLLPAIAYAVDDEVTGANTAFTRLLGASNFSTFENNGFDDNPIWGIYPRATPEGESQSSATRGKITSGSGKITSGNGVIK